MGGEIIYYPVKRSYVHIGKAYNLGFTDNFMALDWLNMQFCIDPRYEDMFKAIKFLRIKLEDSKKEVFEDSKKVKRELLDEAEKRLKYDLRIKPRTDFTCSDVRVFPFNNMESEHRLFFHLDSIIIDIKRIIEFTLKFIAEVNQISIDKFSLDNLIEQISPDCVNTRSKFVNFLFNHHREYIDFLLIQIDWLKEINGKRTHLIHNGIYNRIENLEVTFILPPNEEKSNEYISEVPDIVVFKEEVNIWINLQINKLDELLKRSLKLNSQVMDYQSTINNKRKSKYF